MSLEPERIAQNVINEISEKIHNLKNLNIIVAGKTGVGKSTLINAVFREKLAETGIGKPVTDHMRVITKKNVPLTIYDTRGFELGKDVQKKVKQEIIETITQGLMSKDVNKTIHCIWYCINTASNRIEPEEIEWLKELSNENKIAQVPIIIVLTQSFSKKYAQAMKTTLLNENLDVVQIVPVLAEEYEIDDTQVIPAFGLDTLVNVMSEALPEELLDTLQNVQIASLAQKKRRAHAAVISAAGLVAGEGAIPVAFSDSLLMVPTQVGMIASITVIFGFDINKSILTGLLSATLGAGGATLLGRAAVANIVKLIPGAGSVVGGIISASTASVITIALGEAYIGVLELVFKGEMSIEDLGTEKGKEEMITRFKGELTQRR